MVRISEESCADKMRVRVATVFSFNVQSKFWFVCIGFTLIKFFLS